MTQTPPFALFIRGAREPLFEIADELGFESEMEALAVSLFEDGPDSLHIQALYETQNEADQAAQAYTDRPDLEVFVSQLEDEDWVSKSQQGLPPVIAGPFCIYGEHDKDNLPGDILYPLQIDAGLAFGTGHHGTTQGCLLAFESLRAAGFAPHTALDLGCGAGTLAIAYAKAAGRPVLASDIDPDAVMVTRQNAEINGVTNLVKAEVADGFDHPALKGQSFDLIFANILAEPLMGLAPDIAKALAPDGAAILSGILSEKAQTVAECFARTGLEVTYESPLQGWTSLVARKK